MPERSVLEAIREALREAQVPEVSVLDRLLAEPGTRISSEEVFHIFAALIGVEWRRGKTATFGGMPIHVLVTHWRQTVIDSLGSLEER